VVLCALSLASAIASATNDMNMGQSAQPEITTGRAKPESIQDCQDASTQLASHGYCGQGDLACVAMLETELQNSVEKACVRAIDGLKPKTP